MPSITTHSIFIDMQSLRNNAIKKYSFNLAGTFVTIYRVPDIK